MFSFKKYFTDIKEILGVELFIKNDSLEWRFVSISKNKNELKYENRASVQSNSIPESVLFQVNCPIVLIINGKGIIHKKISKNDLSDQEILAQVIPNINSKEFYVLKYYDDTNEGYISIIRKSQLDPILSLFNKAKLSIIDIYSGPFLFNEFRKALDLSELKYSVSDYTLEYSNDRLDTFNLSNEESTHSIIKIDDEIIEPKYLLAYSTSIVFINQDYKNKFKHSIELVDKNKEEFHYQLIFKKGALTSLITIFTILLINFIFYSIFFEENKKLIVNKGLIENDLKINEQQIKNIEESKAFLRNIGWEDRNRLSPFLDDIASTVPTQLLLTDLTINPIAKSSLTSPEKIFEKQFINIIGNCNLPTDLNTWISDLKKIEWIKGVQVIKYNYDNTKKKGVFNIVINY